MNVSAEMQRRIRAEPSDRVDTFLHGIRLVLSHHGAPSKVIASFTTQATKYLLVPDEGTFLKRAKYMILQPAAAFLRNEPPTEPDLPFVASGHWRRWSRQRLNSFSKKNVHLWYSFLQSKRAAAPVSKEIVLSNFRKHRDQMLAPDPIRVLEGGEELLSQTMESLAPVLRRLSREIAEDLRDLFPEPWLAVHKASESASLESGRKTGGQAGFIRNFMTESGSLREREEVDFMNVRDDVTRRGRKTASGNVERTLIRSGELDRLQTALKREVQKTTSIPRYTAKVEAVIEPFKVRTISKGPSLPYFLAKPVQKAIHTRMRRMDCFRLIGRPFDPTDLMDLTRAQRALLGRESLDDQQWLSIDYSAATDGLSAELSSEIMRALLNSLAPLNLNYYNLLLGVLAPHRVVYPKVEGVTLEPVDQQNGQLMGSVLSFPVLCLANLALYLIVRRFYHPGASVAELLAAVLINGDDMLYIGTVHEWELHKELGRRLGLLMSPGKAYIHPVYANINSMSVVYDLTNARSTPRVIPFLNVGLMVGNHKVMARVGGDDEELQSSPYISVMNEVTNGALPGRQGDVLKQYIAMHSAAVRREAKGRNLFMPISLGGFGVDRPLGITTKYTARQLSLADRAIRRFRFLRPDQRPLPYGRAVEEIMDRKVDPIRVADDPELESQKIREATPLFRPEMLNFPWIEYQEFASRDPESDRIAKITRQFGSDLASYLLEVGLDFEEERN